MGPDGEFNGCSGASCWLCSCAGPIDELVAASLIALNVAAVGVVGLAGIEEIDIRAERPSSPPNLKFVGLAWAAAVDVCAKLGLGLSGPWWTLIGKLGRRLPSSMARILDRSMALFESSSSVESSSLRSAS